MRKVMIRSLPTNRAWRSAGGVLTIVAIIVTSLASITGQSMRTATSKSSAMLTEDQRILHVLNRLGFGARPGDVERVKAMGLENYINQQLNPGSIADPVADAKLSDKNLSTLTMTTAELYEKFPQPGQLL